MFGIDLNLTRVGYVLVTLIAVAGTVIAGVIWYFIKWLKGTLPCLLFVFLLSGCVFCVKGLTLHCTG